MNTELCKDRDTVFAQIIFIYKCEMLLLNGYNMVGNMGISWYLSVWVSAK